MPRSRSPTSVAGYPTMMEPRRTWVVRGVPVDLYQTRNDMAELYSSYRIPPQAYRIIDAFLDEMRFATEPNMNRWPAIPRPFRGGEPLDGTNWLTAYGVRLPVINLDMEIPDDIDFDDVDENGNFIDAPSDEETVFEDAQMFSSLGSVAEEIDRFMDRVLEE